MAALFSLVEVAVFGYRRFCTSEGGEWVCAV